MNIMASVQEMKDLLDEINQDSSVPGLDFDSVVDNMVEKQNKVQLDACETPAERTAMKTKLVDYQKTIGSSFVNEQMNTIKSSYTTVKDGVVNLNAAIGTLAVQLATPSVITAPPGSANPIVTMAKQTESKNNLLNACQILLSAFSKLLQAAVNILFEVPDSIIVLLQTINTIKTTLNALP